MVNVSSGTGPSGSPGQRPLNSCVCACVRACVRALKSQNSFLIIVASLTYVQVLLNDLIHFSVQMS